MIEILEFLQIGKSLFDMNDKQVPIPVNKFQCSVMGFTCGHEAKHFDKGARLKLIDIFFGQFTASVQSHLRDFLIGLLQKVLVVQSD